MNLEFRNPGNIRAEGGGGHVPVSDYAAKVFCFLLFFGGEWRMARISSSDLSTEQGCRVAMERECLRARFWEE